MFTSKIITTAATVATCKAYLAYYEFAQSLNKKETAFLFLVPPGIVGLLIGLSYWIPAFLKHYNINYYCF